MQREFIPYEEALQLKELGFDEPCFGYYDNPENQVWITNSPPYYANKENVSLAPLYQQAFRWFREKHGWVAEINAGFWFNYYFARLLEPSEGHGYDMGKFATYEDAQLACLRKLIEFVKNNEK